MTDTATPATDDQARLRQANQPGAPHGEYNDNPDPAERELSNLHEARAIAQNLSGVGWVNTGIILGDAWGMGTVGAAGPLVKGVDETTVIDSVSLEKLAATFVRPPEYATAEAALKGEGVVVLQGPWRCGKTWLGIRLLHSAGVQPIHRVRSLSAIPRKLEQHAGYLIDDLNTEDTDQLDIKRIRQYQDQALAAKSFLVVTIDDEVPITRARIAPFLVPLTGLPDPEKILNRGLSAHFDGVVPPLVEQVRQEPWVRDFLDARPMPSAVAWLVAVLVEVGESKIDRTDARARFDQGRAHEVAALFERSALRDRCFIVAAAVLQGTSFEHIDDAAQRLEVVSPLRRRRSHAHWRRPIKQPRTGGARSPGGCSALGNGDFARSVRTQQTQASRPSGDMYLRGLCSLSPPGAQGRSFDTFGRSTTTRVEASPTGSPSLPSTTMTPSQSDRRLRWASWAARTWGGCSTASSVGPKLGGHVLVTRPPLPLSRWRRTPNAASTYSACCTT